MDTDEVMHQFDRLEGKIEALIEQCQTLEGTNSELRSKVAELESELDQKHQAENKHSEQKALIRSKLDNLLARLNGVSEIRRTG